MDEPPVDPIRETDDEARRLARSLIDSARIASLAVRHPETSHPHVTRIAVAPDGEGALMSLVSELSLHTRALKTNRHCSLLVGEPETKGDPLNSPRLTLACEGVFCGREAPEFSGLQMRYLEAIPKAKVYADFLDFSFVRFRVQSGSLNGGFARAYELADEDLIGP